MDDRGDGGAGLGHQIIFAMDSQGICTMSIGPGLLALGLAPGELVGVNLLGVYQDDDIDSSNLRRALAGESFTVQQETNGRTLWSYFQAQHDATGAFTGSVGVSTDVTDQLRLEAEARVARDRASVLADLSTELSRDVLDPDAMLRTGTRVTTSALGDLGVLWLVDESRTSLVPRAFWHADPAVRKRVEEAASDIKGLAGWLDVETLDELAEPKILDVHAPPRSLEEVAAVQETVELAALRHGLRLPVRSRGRTIGLLDLARGEERGPFTQEDIVFAQDVSERFTLAYDNALLVAEQQHSLDELLKFKSLADASGDLITITDPEGRPTYINPSLHASGIDVSGETIWGTIAAYAEPSLLEMWTAMATEGRWRGDLTLTLDGLTVIVLGEVFNLSHPTSEEPLGIAWIGQDVTSLRAAEQGLRTANAELRRFQSLVEASSDFIAMADPDSRLRYINPAGRRMIGLAPDFDVTQTVIADYLTTEGRARVREIEEPALRAHGHWEGESTLRNWDGPPIPVAISTFFMHEPGSDEPFGFATVQRDISERLTADTAVRELGEQRQALLGRLVEAQEAEREQIARDVHDDSVQALAAVDLRLGLLGRRLEEQSPGLLETLVPVQESVAHATERLRALLFDLESPDLADSLSSALRRAAFELFRGTEIQVSIDDDDEPLATPGTRSVAYRVAHEALINVRKHSGARRVELRLAEEDDGLLLVIADDGVGLPPGLVESSPGHYGLTSMKDRVTLAGGRWRIANGADGGAVVTVWLPGTLPG